MIEKTFQLDGPALIEMSVPSGSVTIEEGPPGEVQVTVHTSRPEEWDVGQSGNTVWVRRERGAFGGGRARVRIVAPAGSSLNGSTAAADVRIAPRLDQVSFKTASGDVTIGDAGSLELKTASGDVRFRSVDGDLELKSASGDVQADRVGGRAQITTASGDVDLAEGAGDMALSSASGDFRVRRYSGEALEAATMSGDVRLGLPAGRTVKLEAKTLSGSVRLPERKAASGAGGPTVTLRMKSVSGDIVIDRLD